MLNHRDVLSFKSIFSATALSKHFCQTCKLLSISLVASLLVAPIAHAAGYDCAKASTKVEKMICQDTEISKLDEKLAAGYRYALEADRNIAAWRKNPIIKAQVEWLKERNACSDIKCIKKSYEERIDVLIGKYVLIMSKDDNLCGHMLNLYNRDLDKYGEVRYNEHEEFNWIKWEDKTLRIRPPCKSIFYKPSTEKAQAAIFDLNNDSVDEVIVYTESHLSSNLLDVYDIFPYSELAIFDQIVEGKQYFNKKLKSFDSFTGGSLSISELSEEDIKKLPERSKYYLEAEKKRGAKETYFVGAPMSISFLSLYERFYVYFEEYRDNTYHGDGGQYGMIYELEDDNTLKNQCLFLIKKSLPNKRSK